MDKIIDYSTNYSDSLEPQIAKGGGTILQNKWGVALPQLVKKSWGHELIHFNREYCMKELYMNKDGATSIHFHINKHETLMVVKGIVEITIYNKDAESRKVILSSSFNEKAFVVCPGLVHRIRALEDAIVVEASTYSEDADSIRIGV